jgi:hypothetical protein
MLPPTKMEERIGALEKQVTDMKASQDRSIKLSGWVKHQLIICLKKLELYDEKTGQKK